MRFRSIGALVTAALIFPAGAAASIDPKPTTVAFDLTLRGTQTTTWHTFTKGRPPCAASVTTDGDQTIRFHTSRPQRVWVQRVLELPPQLGSDPSVTATAERNMEFRTGKPIIVNRKCVKIVPIAPYVEKGCAPSHDGTIVLDLGFDDQDQLRIRGRADYGAGRPLAALYPACPMLVPISGYPPNNGDLLDASGYLRENGLFGTRKVLKMSSSHVYPFSGPHGMHGQSIITYNLTLTRVASQSMLHTPDRAYRIASRRVGNPAPRHSVGAGAGQCAALIVADGNRILRFHGAAPRAHFKVHPVGLQLPGHAADYRGGGASHSTPQVCGRPTHVIHRPPYRGDRR